MTKTKIEQTRTDKTLDEYNSLSPIDDADKDGHYYDALLWALDNKKEKDIKNIALTGPYGSGKSSVLKSFQKRYEEEVKGKKKHAFIHISLATFKEEKESKAVKTDDNQNYGGGNVAENPKDGEKKAKPILNEELSRLIELSILQQIFYHEKDKATPDSNFKRIKSQSKSSLVTISIILSIYAISISCLIFPDLLPKIFNIQSVKIKNIIQLISYLITIAGTFGLIQGSIRNLRSFSIKKLKIKDAEIEVNQNINKSILNHHIDEILYFFEVTGKNVLIIEDLDRFEQTDIFTKLREINLLLNNSKKVKEKTKGVVFIYAVRDDIFIDDKERTKFFDFILPIIPVINSSNSKEKLLNSKSLSNISKGLIIDISLFIDDMRLLHNIVNEYTIYWKKLGEGQDLDLKQDQLLAMIVYKNLYPNDFMKLNMNEGSLYETINMRNTYIKNTVNSIDLEISRKQKEIKDLNSIKISDLKELRSLYILKYISSCQNFDAFWNNNQALTINEMLNDKYFELLQKGSITKYSFFYYTGYQWNQSNSNFNSTFQQIENEVDPNYTYLKREQLIEDWNNNKLEVLKSEIEKYERQKKDVKNKALSELLSDGKFKTVAPDETQGGLINILLSNGYIQENYLDYISIFYAESLTRTDKQFIINVKTPKSTDFSYRLNKIENLINDIEPRYFKKEHILNIDLMNFLLKNKEKAAYIDIFNSIFETLANESSVSFHFIESYIELGKETEFFIQNLCKLWINSWSFINSHETLTKEKKRTYFELIINYADIENIQQISSHTADFKEYLLQQTDFLSIGSDVQKIKNLISSLDLKFTNLDYDESHKEFYDLIYQKNHYVINYQTLKLILTSRVSYDQSIFDTKNYFALKQANCPTLLEYINQNINEYIKNVYLKIEPNVEEDEGCLIELLNNESLNVENKKLIVKKTETIISDLSKINDLVVDDILLLGSKVKPTWDNIFNHYSGEENKITESILSFINNKDNASELSKSKIKRDVGEDKTFKNFIFSLINTNGLSIDRYHLILKSVPYVYTNFNVSSFSDLKVEALVTNQILSFNTDNFDNLKTKNRRFHIDFVEKNKVKFINSLSEYKLDEFDVNELLKSNTFTIEEKFKLLQVFENIVIGSNEVLKLVSLLISSSNLQISDTLLRTLLLENISPFEKIKIFKLKAEQIPNEVIEGFLKSLPEPYCLITAEGEEIEIEDRNLDKDLLNTLKSKGYISKYTTNKKGTIITKKL